MISATCDAGKLAADPAAAFRFDQDPIMRPDTHDGSQDQDDLSELSRMCSRCMVPSDDGGE
jgi:hypothetical protein